jgi:hypothetical protein
VPDYQTVHILTKVFTSNFFVTAPILGLHTSEEYSIWIISFSCWFRGITVPFCVCQVSSVSTRDAEGPGYCGSGVFTAEQVDAVGDKGSGDTTMVDAKKLLEDFQTWDYFPQLLNYQDFQSIRFQIKGILLHI